MSTLEVNSIQPLSSGTTVTLGASGKTFNIPSGCTISNSGTATGFGGNNTPHFSVGGGGQNISNASWTKLNASSVDFNVGSAYDSTTNYRFNVPSDGVYFFGATASFNGLGDNVSYGLRFYIDGSTDNAGRAYIQHAGSSDGEGYISSTILLDLNTDQYVEVYVFQGDGTTNATTGGTVFTGFKLIGA